MLQPIQGMATCRNDWRSAAQAAQALDDCAAAAVEGLLLRLHYYLLHQCLL